MEGLGFRLNLPWRVLTLAQRLFPPKSQLQNESLTSVLKKVEAESQFVAKQIETSIEKQQRLQEVGC